ncbi:hypothetical protein BDF14DRAFT_1877463 [Spinellus fusiger]|nr:hypothetical protein BDF14DRAFT_1877463 [Spinellus fusiger]
MTIHTDVFNQANAALDNLSSVWDAMMAIIQTTAAAASNSLTKEPDLIALQGARKTYETFINNLTQNTEWLENNMDLMPAGTPDTENSDTPYRRQLLREQEELRKESESLSQKLHKLLSQSYALQFQIDMLLSSSHEQAIDSKN